METIEQLIGHHALFRDLDPEFTHLIAGCAKNVQFPDNRFLFREGNEADCFYLVRDGVVSLEAASPKAGNLVIQTVHAGEVVGWSWLFPPFRWHFDARIVEPVRATRFDGKCLRKKCDENPRLGYELMKRFSGMLLARLQSTRLQLIEAYEAVRETRGTNRP